MMLYNFLLLWGCVQVARPETGATWFLFVAHPFTPPLTSMGSECTPGRQNKGRRLIYKGPFRVKR